MFDVIMMIIVEKNGHFGQKYHLLWNYIVSLKNPIQILYAHIDNPIRIMFDCVDSPEIDQFYISQVGVVLKSNDFVQMHKKW